MTTSLDYKIPLGEQHRTLPVRVQPIDKELLRSYFRRVAVSNFMEPIELLHAVQCEPIQYDQSFPAGFGVITDDEYARKLGRSLRCTAEEIESLLLKQDHIDPNDPPAHPGTLRACAECQLEDGAWRRWNADPLYVVCPIHKTLLWDERPGAGALNAVLLLSRETIDWSEHKGHRPSPKLFGLQDRLVAMRKQALVAKPEVGPTEVVDTLTRLYRRTLDLDKGSRALAQIARQGWSELKSADRDPTPPPASGAIATQFRAEDVAAVLPKAVAAAEAAMQGDTEPYDSLYGELFELSGSRRLTNVSSNRNEGNATVEQAAPPESQAA